LKDIDADNILINFAIGSRQPLSVGASPAQFRSLFPVRYYLNDFELAVCFDVDSDPSTRLVTGLPTTMILDGEYGRDKAPEMTSNEPYCPFLNDIWQMGNMFKYYFGVCTLLYVTYFLT
jgi:hypothetical protein